MLRRKECEWLFFLADDAVVSEIGRGPRGILSWMEHANPASNRTAMYSSCFSPLGHALECDTGCCRAEGTRSGCGSRLHGEASRASDLCKINGGVFFLRNAPVAHSLLHGWEKYQIGSYDGHSTRQALNLLREAQPMLIGVVGGQVMNTHSVFHSGMLRSANPAVTYDIALRLSTSNDVSSPKGPRPGKNATKDAVRSVMNGVNLTLYNEVALSSFGHPIGSTLRRSFEQDIGRCPHDPDIFICHAFGRPMPMKVALVRTIANDRRPQLEQMVREREQGDDYLTAAQAMAASQHYVAPDANATEKPAYERHPFMALWARVMLRF